MSTLRRTFAEGLAVMAPFILLTILVWWIYSFVSSLPLVSFIEPPLLRVSLVLTGFLIVALVVGRFVRTTIGRIVDRLIHDLINFFPFVRIIYNTVKRTLETILSESELIQKPVKVETWNGCQMVAFKTGHQTADGREVIFIPGAPEVTSGFVAEVEPECLLETDESFLEALVRLLSGGFGDAANHDR